MPANDDTQSRADPSGARPDGATVPGGPRIYEPDPTRVRPADTEPDGTLVRPAGAATALLPGGPTIPGYELAREIARGGMGVV